MNGEGQSRSTVNDRQRGYVPATVEVHVYRNRSDDNRSADELYYCDACTGWYGVQHDTNHCQSGGKANWRPQQCACRFCCEATGRPIQGGYGLITRARRWQP